MLIIYEKSIYRNRVIGGSLWRLLCLAVISNCYWLINWLLLLNLVEEAGYFSSFSSTMQSNEDSVLSNTCFHLL